MPDIGGIMLVVDVNQKPDQAYWREYAPGVRAKLKPLSSARMRKHREAAKTIKSVFENGRWIDKEVLDPDMLDKLIMRDIIDDLEGFVDPDGNKLPVDDPSIDTIAENFIQFVTWAAYEAGILAEAMAREKAAALKNSKGSHDGSEADRKK